MKIATNHQDTAVQLHSTCLQTMNNTRGPNGAERNFPNQLSRTGKIFENSTKLTCLEIVGDRIKYKYNTVLSFLELQIRHSQKV